MTKRFLEELSILETDVEKRKYLEEKTRGLPVKLLEDSVVIVAGAIKVNNPELLYQLKIEKDRLGYGWIESYYVGFGHRVRNMLRDIICDDNELPEGDWSFYYAQIVEMALGLW